MYGIDIAESDGSVNWVEVKNSGKTFAFAKATEGKTVKDGMFQHHWSTMKEYSIARGAYHFFHPKSSSPVDQAHEFLKTIGNLDHGDLPPVLDVETTDDHAIDSEDATLSKSDRTAIISGIKQWLGIVEDAIRQQTGKNICPIIYTGVNYWKNILGDPHDFQDYPLWIAHYGVTSPSVPDSWGNGNWLIHQYEGDVSNVAGVQYQADLNRFNTFTYSSQGLIVRDIQQRLKNIGLFSGEINGAFTGATESAVVNFQKSKKLQADGIVGLKTWLELIWA